MEDVEVAESDLQVWLRLDELARLFVLEIEGAGDRITETAETPRSRSVRKIGRRSWIPHQDLRKWP